MIYATLIIYAVIFWAVAWLRPAAALMFILAAAPFQNDVSGGGAVRFSFAELHLLLTLPVYIIVISRRQQMPSLGALQWPVAAYLGVCLLSAFATWRGNVAIVSFIQMFLFMVVAVLLFSSLLEKPEELMLALHALIAVTVFFSIVLIVSRTNYVLGIHKNGVGGSLSCSILVCLELWLAAKDRKRKILLSIALVLITAGLVFTLSRGAWLGAFLGTILIMALRRQFGLMLRVGLILIPIIAICWQALPKESKDYATDFNSKRGNLAPRYQSLEFTRTQFEESPIYGVGLGLRKQYDATNLVWMNLAETGVLGLVTFALIHGVFFRLLWMSRKRFEQTDPLYSLLAIGGALILARVGHGMVDHYWARGPTFMAWAAVGMAMGAIYAAPRTQHAPRRRILTALAFIEILRMEKTRHAS